jgi:hypothetical protein
MDRNFIPDYYDVGTKVIFEDGSNAILIGTAYLSPGNYYLGKKILAIEIPEARAEINRRAAEQVERNEREDRERAEEAARRREWEAARRREWDAGADERQRQLELDQERRRIENARPYDNNNPAPANNYGPDGRPHWHQHGMHWGGSKSRRGRKSKKPRKSRSKKRRSNKSNKTYKRR